MSETEQPPVKNRPATSDVVGTVILCLVGVVAVVMGFGYGFMEDNGQVGAGFLPVLTGGFVVLATLLELARMYLAHSSPIEGSFMETVVHLEEEAGAAIARAHHEDADAGGDAGGMDSEELDTFGRTKAQRTSAIGKIFGIMLVAILLIPVLGLLISLTLMTLVLLLVVERKPWVPSVLATLGALAFFYFVFVQGLRVPLPTGLLGII